MTGFRTCCLEAKTGYGGVLGRESRRGGGKVLTRDCEWVIVLRVENRGDFDVDSAGFGGNISPHFCLRVGGVIRPNPKLGGE